MKQPVPRLSPPTQASDESRCRRRYGPSPGSFTARSPPDAGGMEHDPGPSACVRMLNRRGTMRLSTISDRLQIAPRTATEVVDALQARDLVRRRATRTTGADPGRSDRTRRRRPGRDPRHPGPEAGASSPASARPTAPNWPASSASSGTKPGRLSLASLSPLGRLIRRGTCSPRAARRDRSHRDVRGSTPVHQDRRPRVGGSSSRARPSVALRRSQPERAPRTIRVSG